MAGAVGTESTRQATDVGCGRNLQAGLPRDPFPFTRRGPQRIDPGQRRGIARSSLAAPMRSDRFEAYCMGPVACLAHLPPAPSARDYHFLIKPAEQPLIAQPL